MIREGFTSDWAERRSFVKTVRRSLKRNGWKTLTNSSPVVDLFVRKLHKGHRLIVCFTDWHQVTPFKLSDMNGVGRVSAAPVVCVFPDAIPDIIRKSLVEHRLRVALVTELDTIDALV